MKPEKVKSRWRRNNETENTLKSTMTPSVSKTCEENSSSENDKSFDEDSNESVSNQSSSFPVYESLNENVYLFEIKRTKEKKEVRRMLCDCPLAGKNDIPCGDECLNRLLMIECGSRCVNGDSCSNKRFQKQQYAKTEPFMTAKKGWGLRLLEDVPKGSFIAEYIGEVINPKEFKARVKQYARKRFNHFYFMSLKSDQIIDATMKANEARFINHSCDPNCDTQKWTVNGLLRVGFFAKRLIKAGEELTFDYRFQRYGQKAQKCFCQTEKCTGFIGVSSDVTVDIYKNESKCNKRKKLEKEDKKEMEDFMLEEEIEKLSLTGIRNKDESLMLARLMVRAENVQLREKLLDIILDSTEAACLRLFLDYHGLNIMWSWMAYLKDSNLKTKILKVLSLLPVPNRTVLIESKVLKVVENWASLSFFPESKTKSDTGRDTDGTTMQTADNSFNCSGEEKEKDPSEKESMNNTKLSDTRLSPGDESTDFSGFSVEDDESRPNTVKIAALAQNLIVKWSLLKDDFRIPRLETKNEGADSLTNDSNSDHINLNNVAMPVEHNSVNKKEPKDFSKVCSTEKPQKIKVICNNLSKEIESSFYQTWGEYPHESRKKDGRFYEKKLEGGEGKIWKNCNDRKKKFLLPTPFQFNGIIDYHSPSNPTNHSYLPQTDGIHEYPGVRNQFDTTYPFLHENKNPVYRKALLPTPVSISKSNISRSPGFLSDGGCDTALISNCFYVPQIVLQQTHFSPVLPNISSTLPLPPPRPHVLVVPDSVKSSSPQVAGDKPNTSDALPFANFHNQTSGELPPNWKAATDGEGNVYYYHTVDRISQWEFPTACPMGKEPAVAVVDSSSPTYHDPDLKHDRKSHKKYSKRKSVTTAAPADTSSVDDDIFAKKIEELFRRKMSSHVVSCLNPYRKDNCTVGKITSNEDFKYLARQLTHFIIAKELKHCKNVEDLDCNKSVRRKARVYIDKMMARYGPIYKRGENISSDEKYAE